MGVTESWSKGGFGEEWLDFQRSTFVLVSWVSSAGCFRKEAFIDQIYGLPAIYDMMVAWSNEAEPLQVDENFSEWGWERVCSIWPLALWGMSWNADLHRINSRIFWKFFSSDWQSGLFMLCQNEIDAYWDS